MMMTKSRPIDLFGRQDGDWSPETANGRRGTEGVVGDGVVRDRRDVLRRGFVSPRADDDRPRVSPAFDPVGAVAVRPRCRCCSPVEGRLPLSPP